MSCWIKENVKLFCENLIIEYTSRNICFPIPFVARVETTRPAEPPFAKILQRESMSAKVLKFPQPKTSKNTPCLFQ